MSAPADDPAIISSKERRPAQTRAVPVPAPSLLPIPLLTTRKDEEANEYAPAINDATQAVYSTADGVFAVVPRGSAERLPLPPAAEGATAFPFSFETLTALYFWCEKYTATGSCPSVFATKSNFIDFNLLLSSDWDKQYFKDVLSKGEGAARCIAVINAAEHFKMEGLLTFAVTALSCTIRGRTQGDALKYFGVSDAGEVTAAEKDAISTAYPWFAGATAVIVKH